MKYLILIVLIVALFPFYCMATNSTTTSMDTILVIDDIQCSGNVSTACSFIASHLYLSSGEQINEEEIHNAKLRLSSLTNFKSVDIHLEKGTQRGRVIIVIEVIESSPITKEAVIGTSSNNSSLGQKVIGRIGNQNLFGTGKILDLELGGKIPLAGPKQRDFSSRLQYTDPNLLESKKYFGTTGVSYQNSFYTYKNGGSNDSRQFGLDLSLGRRLWDFSYLIIGYQHRPSSKTVEHYKNSNGTNEISTDSNKNVFLLNYGWNSEDDAYFPTKGSRFNISNAWLSSQKYNSVYKFALAYRTTWKTENNSILTFKLGGTPGTEYRQTLEEDLGISLSYARLLSQNSFGGIERGRWYIEPGLVRFGHSSYDGYFIDPGLKVGIRFETEGFGVVDLYAIGSTEWRVGRNK
ncbi:MAG: BamA/TamA family outer membrane protein [Oligoflexia bacterium]|nr:BamA/TamA family outer membrane protein [Oligoflexia bacterium]